MPRRAEKPLFEEIAEEFEHLPARAGLLTAALLVVVGWAIPLFFSGPVSIASALALAGRYLLWLLALMVLLSTAYGATRRWLDRRRFDATMSLDDLSWDQFEGYLAEYFRRRGCSVTPRGGASPDGGVDLILDDASGRRIVQAKHWKTRRVGVVPLRALWGVLDDEHAQGAICVTSGEFTPDALRFAEGKRLELVNGNHLLRLIAEVRAPRSAAVNSPQGSETCPRCERGVLERKLARRGRNAGSYFLSCNRYPDCRYARNL